MLFWQMKNIPCFPINKRINRLLTSTNANILGVILMLILVTFAFDGVCVSVWRSLRIHEKLNTFVTHCCSEKRLTPFRKPHIILFLKNWFDTTSTKLKLLCKTMSVKKLLLLKAVYLTKLCQYWNTWFWRVSYCIDFWIYSSRHIINCYFFSVEWNKYKRHDIYFAGPK